MSSQEAVVVFITAASLHEAQKISQLLLEKRLAACVNLLPTISSAFWWEGSIQGEKESLLIVKSVRSKLDSLIEEVKRAHSYSVPEIIALPILAGNEDYLSWIEESTTEAQEDQS